MNNVNDAVRNRANIAALLAGSVHSMYVTADGSLHWVEMEDVDYIGILEAKHDSFWFTFAEQQVNSGNIDCTGTLNQVLGFIACYVVYGIN